MDNQKLSARVEALEGPERGIDAQIHFAVREGIGCGMAQDAPRYTASLDAAMSLVPQGCGWIAGWGQVLPDEPMGGAHITAHSVFAGYDVANDVIAEGEAVTPALALCAAALKARGL